MPDDTHLDLSERVAALEQMLVERAAERDEALEYQTATRFTHSSPPRATGRTQGPVALPNRTAARSPGDPARVPLTPTPTLPHQEGGPKATTTDPADPAQLTVDLQ